METLTRICLILTTIATGLMSGALLAEGALLVPFWRSLPPKDFLHWYKQHAALLQNFFGPIEIGAMGLALAAATLGWTNRHPATPLLTTAAALCIVVLAVFPIYFQKANTSFRTAAIPPGKVNEELRRWSHWHWARTVISVAAFGAATIAITH